MPVLLQQAFRTAASELGMASAAWLFVKEAAGLGGEEGVSQLRDALGRLWPVLDAVCVAWQTGSRQPLVEQDALLAELAGVNRVLVIGMEASWLDALVQRLPDPLQVGLIQHGDTVTDWARMLDAPMDVYPRWLVAASAETLTAICPPQWCQRT